MFEALTKKHQGEWVALHGDDLIFAESLPELVQKCDEHGFDRDLMATRWLTTEKVVRVL